MTTNTGWRGGTLSIVIFLAAALSAPAQETQRGGIEEIVVTARKREERLIDTPVSITALSETALRDAGVVRLDEIQELVPNLQFSVGRENQEGFIRLRGVGTASGEIVFDPGVAVYVDGVYLPRMIGQLVDTIDIQQVEVLRGPQGTLFGKNSVGGAINITTVKPQDELSGQVLVRAGNFDTVRTRSSLNIPLIEERLLSRFAFATNNSGGFSRNEALDLDVSDQASMTFLGSLRLLLTDDITVDLSGTWARDHGHGRGGQCRIVNDDGLGLAAPGFREACENSEPFRFRGNVSSLSDTSSWGSWGTVQWDALQGPVDLTVKSITSWREQKPGHLSESDLTELPVLSLDFSGSPENPTWAQRQISQEMQGTLSAWDDRFNLVAGAFSFWERGTAPTTVRALTGILDVETQSTTHISNWTWALFAHSVVTPVDWLSLTYGIRYTQDKKGATFLLENRGDPNAPEPTQAKGSKVFDDLTQTVSVGLKATDTILDALRLDHGLLYFTWAQGFRGGGFNSLINVQGFDGDELPSFEPETIDSFEVGIKTVAFDNRVNFNIAAFYGDYTNIQVFSTRATGDLDDPLNSVTIQQLTQNAAAATVQGIEAEMLVQPVDALRVSASVGLLNTEYDDFGSDCNPTVREERSRCAISDVEARPEEAVFIDRSGQGFNLTPDLTTHLALSYDIPVDTAALPFLDGQVTPRLDWSYQSRMHVLGPEAFDGIQHGFHLLNARLSYDLFDDSAQIAIYGKNLTDEAYFDRAESFPVLGFMGRYFQDPRTFGGEVSFRF